MVLLLTSVAFWAPTRRNELATVWFLVTRISAQPAASADNKFELRGELERGVEGAAND